MNYDENDVEPITTPDTLNRTKINANEGDDPIFDKNGDYKWDRLSLINTGAADSFGNRNESVTREQERASIFDVIADHLCLIDPHKREGRELMKSEIDTQKLSSPQSSPYLIAFCVAVHLVNRDDIERSYHPNRFEYMNDDIFVEVANDFNFDNSLINSFVQKVENEL